MTEKSQKQEGLRRAGGFGYFLCVVVPGFRPPENLIKRMEQKDTSWHQNWKSCDLGKSPHGKTPLFVSVLSVCGCFRGKKPSFRAQFEAVIAAQCPGSARELV